MCSPKLSTESHLDENMDRQKQRNVSGPEGRSSEQSIMNNETPSVQRFASIGCGYTHRRTGNFAVGCRNEKNGSAKCFLRL